MTTCPQVPDEMTMVHRTIAARQLVPPPPPAPAPARGPDGMAALPAFGGVGSASGPASEVDALQPRAQPGGRGLRLGGSALADRRPAPPRPARPRRSARAPHAILPRIPLNAKGHAGQL
jgi:hypothetical protein